MSLPFLRPLTFPVSCEKTSTRSHRVNEYILATLAFYNLLVNRYLTHIGRMRTEILSSGVAICLERCDLLGRHLGLIDHYSRVS